MLTRSTKLSLSQTYTDYNQSGGATYTIDRLATMLTLRTEWQ